MKNLQVQVSPESFFLQNCGALVSLNRVVYLCFTSFVRSVIAGQNYFEAFPLIFSSCLISLNLFEALTDEHLT